MRHPVLRSIFLLNSVFSSKITWKKLPSTEIFYNIFLFLDRVELEKCQLLNKHFNSMIIGGDAMLPLQLVKFVEVHRLGKEQIDLQTDDFNDVYKIEDLEIEKIKSLKNCVIQNCRINMKHIEKVEFLRQFFNKWENPLKILEFSIECRLDTLNFGWISEILGNFFEIFSGGKKSWLKSNGSSMVERVDFAITKNHIKSGVVYQHLRAHVYF